MKTCFLRPLFRLSRFADSLCQRLLRQVFWEWNKRLRLTSNLATSMRLLMSNFGVQDIQEYYMLVSKDWWRKKEKPSYQRFSLMVSYQMWVLSKLKQYT